VAGFAAATYLRRVDWIAVPTTLVGQVDAAIGGKTAINLPEGKNLVGAFHWPRATLIDPELLITLPDEQRREGLAEVVKTGLLTGEPLWELPDEELVRRCAAFKTALCIRDPYDQGPRHVLNLGHTFAHALEAGSNGAVTHGRAVALGLLAALKLSGKPTEAVEQILAPRAVRADRERAWTALQRDKKSTGDELMLVLLGEDGGYTAPVPAADVRRALDELIAD
jgi:3-dehydroquinate synthetase